MRSVTESVGRWDRACGVAGEQCDLLQRSVMLTHGEDVGGICGCHSLVSPFHTGPRVIGELFDGGLGEAAERGAVIHAAQHPGRVRDGRPLAAVGHPRA